jgi:large subunit ribosomal protein L1
MGSVQRKPMPRHSRRFREASQKVDALQRYETREALELVKSLASTKLDESVDIALRLGVNPRHSDQMVRGAVSLPHGTGKTVRIVVFAQGPAAKAAEEAGADHVGANELIQKIQKENWLEFDKAIATRSMMGRVGRLGRVLGPRGLMPNPKVGTVVAEDGVADAVRELRRGKISFRVEKAGIIHVSIGRASMSADQLYDNFCTLLATLVRMKPSTSKGTYVKAITASSTMGPGVKIDPLHAVRVSENF